MAPTSSNATTRAVCAWNAIAVTAAAVGKGMPTSIHRYPSNSSVRPFLTEIVRARKVSCAAHVLADGSGTIAHVPAALRCNSSFQVPPWLAHTVKSSAPPNIQMLPPSVAAAVCMRGDGRLGRASQFVPVHAWTSASTVRLCTLAPPASSS